MRRTPTNSYTKNRKSHINHGDVFVLVLGAGGRKAQFLQWNGSKSSGQERMIASQYIATFRARPGNGGSRKRVIDGEDDKADKKNFANLMTGFMANGVAGGAASPPTNPSGIEGLLRPGLWRRVGFQAVGLGQAGLWVAATRYARL